MEKLNQKDLSHILRTLANVPAFGTGSIHFLPHLLYIKWITDEIRQDPAFSTRSGLIIPDGHSFDDLAKGIDQNQSINSFFRTFYRENRTVWPGISPRFDASTGKTQTLMENGRVNDSILYAIRVLSGISLSPSDMVSPSVVSGAFEEYLSELRDYSASEYEPNLISRPVLETVTRLMDPAPGESVFDPFCKTGDLLMQAHIYAPDSLIFGSEIDRTFVSIALMRQHFAGNFSAAITENDVLAYPALDDKGRLQRYDHVITMIQEPMETPDTRFIERDIHRRFERYEPSEFTPFTYLCHALKTSSEKCVIVNSSTLKMVLRMRPKAPGKIALLLDDLLEAVILFPRTEKKSRFLPETQDVYIFNHKKPINRAKKILFIDATNEKAVPEGMSPYDAAVDAYQKYAECPGFSKIVSVDEIICNKVNLSVQSYTTVFAKPARLDTDKALAEFQELELDRAGAFSTLLGSFADLEK